MNMNRLHFYLLSLQKDIVEPTKFVKTYLEVSLGTGDDFERLKSILGDLCSLLYGAESVFAKIKTELAETKEFVNNEYNLLQVKFENELQFHRQGCRMLKQLVKELLSLPKYSLFMIYQ